VVLEEGRRDAEEPNGATEYGKKNRRLFERRKFEDEERSKKQKELTE
jgi:hypothetical protein